MSINVIWLETNIDNNINSKRSRELEKNNSLNIKLFKKTKDAIKCLKKIEFEETKIIICSSLYSEFLNLFKENIRDICVAPKVIVFEEDKENFIKYTKDFKNNINKFFHYEGIVTEFDKVKKFLNNKQNSLIKNDSLIFQNLSYPIEQKNSKFLDIEAQYKNLNQSNDTLYTFEYIESKEQLMLPLFFKALIDIASNDEKQKYINFLYNTYSNDNNEIKNLLGQIKSEKNIPIEILSKYFARLYTFQCPFHKDLNNELRVNKKDKHLPFIQTLYEGVKLKSLALATNNILYRGSILSYKEINKIDYYINNKNNDLPSSILFSKSFLSFTKSYDEAKKFLNHVESDEKFSKILFILEKDDNIKYNLSTHGDIEKISFYPKEKEVLFFPFSSFEVKSLEEKNIGKEKIYQIKLLYLGKYLENIENDKNIISKENILPDCQFKTQLTDSGLINKELINNMNTKSIYNSFLEYEEEIGEKEIIKNIITGEIEITRDCFLSPHIIEPNKYDEFKNGGAIVWLLGDSFPKSDSYDKVKKNIVIKINGEKVSTGFYYVFEKIGIYKIEYLFSDILSDTSYMFYNRSKIISLDFTKFNSQNVTDMSYMFSDCYSLTNINLSKLDTKNVKKMGHMFYNCSKLKYLDLSNFNTENVIDMNNMFSRCNSLAELDLSNFNTQNVINMNGMFRECENIINLNLSKCKTHKVTNMSDMFYGCENLINLNLQNFNTQNVKSMDSMFYLCKSLTNLDISNFNTQNVIYIGYMFYGCKSIKNIHYSSNFKIKNIKSNKKIFSSGSSITIQKIITSLIGNNNINNIIIGEINISREDINRPIQIINSFENWKKLHLNEENIDSIHIDDREENENELKSNIEIKINGKKIDFTYLYTFDKEGKYKIEYLFKKNLTNTNYMFYQCRNLTKLDFSKFNTENVTNMKWMFRDCYSLTELDLSNFNTKNVKDMSYMFSGCKSLNDLNISNFSSKKVFCMDYMFFWCKSLKSCKFSHSFFRRSKPLSCMNGIFEKCKYFDDSKIDLFLVDDFHSDPSSDSDSDELNCFLNIEYDEKNWKSFITGEIKIDKKDINKSIRLLGDRYELFSLYGKNVIITINGKKIKTSHYHIFKKEGIYKIQYLFFCPQDDLNYMFCECSNIINLDLSKLKTVLIYSMSYMFQNCKSLKNINLSNLNTEYTKYMNNMFQNCYSLTNLNLSNFKTEKVTDMNNMFSSCKLISKLDLSNFNTKNVNDMSFMFSECEMLKDLNISGFDTKNVIKMKGMFHKCLSFTSLDLSNFNTKNVNDMSYMFSGCKFLKNLDLSSFIYESVTDISFMFYGCLSLTNLNFANFDIFNYIKMRYIFHYCISLYKQNIIIEDSQVLNIFEIFK